MSLFPFVNEEEIIETSTNKIPKEYEINFETGQLTGRKVEGVEAVKTWILKVMKSERYKYVAYSFDYGVEIEKFIGKNYDESLIKSELARNVEEALKINPYIKGIEGFNSSFKGTILKCDFTVITDFGEVDISV